MGRTVIVILIILLSALSSLANENKSQYERNLTTLRIDLLATGQIISNYRGVKVLTDRYYVDNKLMP
jgi:hypothetical protein